MIKVGLTGGIGSGKSTVAKIFHLLNIPVFNSDERAKKLLSNNKSIHLKIKQVFGSDVFTDDLIDKQKLADIVFANQEKLSQLNQIIHPTVKEDFEEWIQQYSMKPYIIKEAAILVETGLYQELDKLILVVTQESERIRRVEKRDNTTKEKVKERIGNQLTDEEKLKVADFVIENNEDSFLIEQVLQLDKTLRSL